MARALWSAALHCAPAALVLALSLMTTSCAGPSTASGPRPAVPSEATKAAVEVSDAQFAASLHRLLRDGTPTPERTALLAGVVKRQLAHAEHRFAAGNDAAGTDSVLGALALLRTGEGRREMLDAFGDRALASALVRVSQRGDEGRTFGLLRLRATALPAGTPARVDVDQHLAALTQWMSETRTGGPMRQLGAAERAAVGRALVEPSEEALAAATDLIGSFVDRAIQYNSAFQRTGRRPEREEAIEAARALQSGGTTMAALYLRQGDAKRALEAIDRTGARRVLLPALYERIRLAATDDGARDWQMLARVFEQSAASAENESDAPETDVDPTVMAAALWGASLESYRRAPSDVETGLRLARSLARLGLSDAAPLVVADGLGSQPDPAALSAAMDVVVTALGNGAEADEIGAARRTFAASAAILAAADRPDARGHVEPSAARARLVMASFELREGNLASARPLLAAAITAEPTVTGYTLLALVERQAGDGPAALAHVASALSAPDAASAPLDIAEAHALGFELRREAGAGATAKSDLDAALVAALAARQQPGDAASHARAERLLGRVLDDYGDRKGAARALDRAITAAGEDRPALGAAMLNAVARALVQKDLPAARAAVRRGIDGGGPEDDLIYAGLWLQLLEREQHQPDDGTVERALRSTSRTSWTSKLAAWATDKLSDAELERAAVSAAQRVELEFYLAMSKKIAGDPAADERLRAIARSPIIDLLEVQIARELFTPRVRIEVPPGVALP